VLRPSATHEKSRGPARVAEALRRCPAPNGDFPHSATIIAGMEIRRATADDAERAALVLRRSIAELCHADHRDDAPTLAAWLRNKTAESVRRWVANQHLFVAAEGDAILGVAALSPTGEITLNYVSPDARFRGVSKALIARLEEEATALGLATITLQSTATARKFYAACGYADAGAPVSGFGITQGFPMAKSIAASAR
jgi:GNAT superfamily N-acetyltransferase